jgi:hypothetical protein
MCSFNMGMLGLYDSRMRQGLLAAVLAGCSFSDGNVLTDALSDGVLQDGAPLVVDVPMGFDTDGDGVPDASDNCPVVANATQLNHDGDAPGDACDKCPHLMSATDPDGDGDGVGDACDPRPAVAGDSIAFWEGFYASNSIATWTANGGTWSVANGVLRQSSMTTDDVQLYAPITFMRAAATTEVGAGAFGSATSALDRPHVSVVTGATQLHNYWCSAVDVTAGDRIYATVITAGGDSFPNVAWGGSFEPGSQVQLTSALIGANNECSVFPSPLTLQGGLNGSPTAGGVGLATRTASASFDYLFVVEIGN